MGKYIAFTDAQKAQANAVDLEELLRRRGEKLLPSGREYRLESDHSVTIRGCTWYDHAVRLGGHAISFMQRQYGMSYQEAVIFLLHGEYGLAFKPASEKEERPRKQFALPPACDNMRRLYAYLINQRKIRREIVHAFTRAGLLYEDVPYHNAVFVGKDEHGVSRHAHLRSTNTKGKRFRINVEGSLPQYSFHHCGRSDQLYVFEAPIDLLSFLCLHPDQWQEHHYVALCGSGEQAMLWMLEQYPQVTQVYLALDNDKAGQAATQRLSRLLDAYRVSVLTPQQKDWNDDLVSLHEIKSEK